MDEQAHLVQLAIRLQFGHFSDSERQAIFAAFGESNLGEVRIDEQVVANLGAGGSGDLPIAFEIWLNIAGGTAAGLLTIAISKGIAPVLKIFGRRIVRLQAAIHKDEGEPVTYLAELPAAEKALDAMPADYEETVRTESRTRIWNDGRWERYEETRLYERGTAEDEPTSEPR